MGKKKDSWGFRKSSDLWGFKKSSRLKGMSGIKPIKELHFKEPTFALPGAGKKAKRAWED